MVEPVTVPTPAPKTQANNKLTATCVYYIKHPVTIIQGILYTIIFAEIPKTGAQIIRPSFQFYDYILYSAQVSAAITSIWKYVLDSEIFLLSQSNIMALKNINRISAAKNFTISPDEKCFLSPHSFLLINRPVIPKWKQLLKATPPTWVPT